jgi:hypothetical protein
MLPIFFLGVVNFVPLILLIVQLKFPPIIIRSSDVIGRTSIDQKNLEKTPIQMFHNIYMNLPQNTKLHTTPSPTPCRGNPLSAIHTCWTPARLHTKYQLYRQNIDMIVYKTQPFGACSESVRLMFSTEVVVTSSTNIKTTTPLT